MLTNKYNNMKIKDDLKLRINEYLNFKLRDAYGLDEFSTKREYTNGFKDAYYFILDNLKDNK